MLLGPANKYWVVFFSFGKIAISRSQYKRWKRLGIGTVWLIGINRYHYFVKNVGTNSVIYFLEFLLENFVTFSHFFWSYLNGFLLQKSRSELPIGRFFFRLYTYLKFTRRATRKKNWKVLMKHLGHPFNTLINSV